MKKRLLFLFILCGMAFTFQNVNAQDWAPVGAKWYFTKYFSDQSGVSYSVVESLKDTTVLGINCRKVQGNTSDCTWHTTYTYKSNDSVYFYHPDLNKFCFLYDFGASPGDTWEILNITGSTPDTIILLVDSISQIQVSGQDLKVLYTKMINYTASSQSYFGGKIIENIGGTHFSPSYGYCSPPGGELRCYIDNSISYHTGIYSCTEETVNTQEEFLNKISVYPNPFSDYITIYVDQGKLDQLKIEIVDLKGQVVHQEIFSKKTKSIKINLNSLERGFYILRATSLEDYKVNFITKIFKR